jgi:CO/xanthine dehydrogenase FAD-binding subunit
VYLPKFQYHEPKNLDEAAGLMKELGEEASILAGGTDCLVNLKKRKIAPKHLVYLARIEGLKTIQRGPGSILIGACVTLADLREDGKIKEDFGGLFKAAGLLGSPLIRNLATTGGNIANARPAADLPPPLMAYDASIELKNTGGERILPLREFFLGPGQTVLQPGEILTRILLREPPPCSGGGYAKLGVRNSLEIAIVNVAAFIAMDDLGGEIREARIVLGSVAPKPILAPSAEAVLIGRKPKEEVFERAGIAAAEDAKPIDDFRASASYRREMVKNLTKKALQEAYENATLRQSRRKN